MYLIVLNKLVGVSINFYKKAQINLVKVSVGLY